MSEMIKRLHTGELYLPTDEEIFREQLALLDKLKEYNGTRPSDLDRKTSLLKEMFVRNRRAR